MTWQEAIDAILSGAVKILSGLPPDPDKARQSYELQVGLPEHGGTRCVICTRFAVLDEQGRCQGCQPKKPLPPKED